MAVVLYRTRYTLVQSDVLFVHVLLLESQQQQQWCCFVPGTRWCALDILWGPVFITNWPFLTCLEVVLVQNVWLTALACFLCSHVNTAIGSASGIFHIKLNFELDEHVSHQWVESWKFFADSSFSSVEFSTSHWTLTWIKYSLQHNIQILSTHISSSSLFQHRHFCSLDWSHGLLLIAFVLFLFLAKRGRLDIHL